MGNQLPRKSSTLSCGLNIFPAQTLAQTTLQPLSKRALSPNKLSPIPTRLEVEKQSQDKGDSPDKPDSRSFCHSPRYPYDMATVNENDFHIMQILSSEKLGKVYLVKKNTDGKLYAMKTFCKKRAYSLDCIDSVDIEKNILEDARHPFIPNIKYTFENDKRIFFLIEYFEANDLRTILQSLTRFSEEITKFYSAEILTVLEYLSKDMNIIFDNLQLDHILVDSDGHIKLAKFEGAQYGTRITYNFWHLGCLIYEMLTGNKPFASETSMKDIKLETLEDSLQWSASITATARDLVVRLLSGRFDESAGFSTFDEIKKHVFFADIRWDKVLQKHVYPPLSPSLYKSQEEEEEEGFQPVEQDKPSFVNFDVTPTAERDEKNNKIFRGNSCFDVFETGCTTNDG